MSLVMQTIWQVGAGSQLSLADTETVTGTIFPFTLVISFGVTVADRITGQMQSFTVSVVEQVVQLPAASFTVTVIVVTPTPTSVPACGLCVLTRASAAV